MINLSRIKLRGDYKKALFNTNWLLVEKILRLITGVVVGIWIARYLGPEQFGMLNYTISLIAILGAFTSFGLINYVVKELVNTPDKSDEILGTSFYLRLSGGFIAVLVVLIYNSFTADNSTLFILMLIASFNVIFQAFDVIDLSFQARTEFKYPVICRSISIILISIMKVILILSGQNIIWFALSYLLEFVLSAIFMLLAYGKFYGSINKWKFSINRAKNYLSKTWPLIFSSLAAVIYLKVDQVMLRELAGDVETGLYAAAVRISEVWYFIPTLIVSAVFPYLVKNRKENRALYHKRLQMLIDGLFVIAVFAALIVSISSPFLIHFVFGQEYKASVSILQIHIWSAVFVFMRAPLSRWIIIEDVLSFSLVSHISGAIMNVALNFILIPKYGAMGSAFATLISYAFPTYFICFFYPKARIMAKMMTLTFLVPFRYPVIIFKRLNKKQVRKLEA